MKLKIYILFFLISSSIFAQQNQVETKIDKVKNKIGAQFNVTFKTTVDTNATVVFPKAKNFGSLEVIRSYVVDTIKKGSQYELIKQYGLTQFDSGKYVIPKMPILINNKPFYSDTLQVHVSDVVVDTLKQKMFDIKSVIQETKSIGNWWKYLLGFLIILGIGALIYYLLKRRQDKKLAQEGYASPIEKAIGLLKNLEKKQLWQKGETKTYYSELTDIAREYIEEVIQIPAKESTTNELILGLKKAITNKKLKLTKESVANLEKVLKQADLVKFAKSQPLDFEIAEDQKRIEKSIISLHQSIPTETEEEDILTVLQQKEKALKKQKTKRILIAVSAVIFLLFATTTYLVVTRGFSYLKDNIFGRPTKELLEGKWVYSEYGNPSIGIETPKVLKRVDSKKFIPNEAMVSIKEISMFEYGSIMSDFYTLLSTTTFKQAAEIDLNKSIDGSLEAIKARGAQNVVEKRETFQTKDGTEGMKSFGTLNALDPVLKVNHQFYFEIVVLKQDGGVQQIVVFHKEGDQYGNQVADRIINSIQLKSTK